jgi:hypothetical protein
MSRLLDHVQKQADEIDELIVEFNKEVGIDVTSSSSASSPLPRDMEIARLLGWYRIPLRTAPKVVAVDYLAFYQPASFGERSGQIEYIAQVRGHELTTRGELAQR